MKVNRATGEVMAASGVVLRGLVAVAILSSAVHLSIFFATLPVALNVRKGEHVFTVRINASRYDDVSWVVTVYLI